MSLTRHLKSQASPVRAFFETRLARTGAVVQAAAEAIRAGRAVAPLHAAPEVDARLAAMAADLLVRSALAPKPFPEPVFARLGAVWSGRAALAAVDDALRLVRETDPARREVSDAAWDELTRACLLLAAYERAHRARRAVDLGWTDADVEDVAMLGWATVQDHADLRGRPLVANPRFAQTSALGGAEGDLLTDDGTLVDMKATEEPLGREALWQLCGYALADTDDRHRIRSVAIWSLRWRAQVTWPLGELLDALAGQPTDLAALRDDFARLLRERPGGGDLVRRRA